MYGLLSHTPARNRPPPNAVNRREAGPGKRSVARASRRRGAGALQCDVRLARPESSFALYDVLRPKASKTPTDTAAALIAGLTLGLSKA